MKKYLASALVLASVCTSAAFAIDEGRSENNVFVAPRMVDNRSEYMPHVGLLIGGAGLNGSQYDNSVSYTLDAGFQPVIPFGLGLQAQFTPGESAAPGLDNSFDTTNVLVKTTYNFGGTTPVLRDAYIGAKSGITTYSTNNVSTTKFSAGPTLGFDIPLTMAKEVSLGAEATYLAVFGDDFGTPDQTSVLGAMKYWF